MDVERVPLRFNDDNENEKCGIEDNSSHEHRNEEVRSHTVAREWIASPELSRGRTPLWRSPAARCS